MIEELDAPNEYFYDNRTRQLYYFPNTSSTTAALPPRDVVVPTLSVLVHVLGTRAQPVQSITLQGLSFTQTRPTFFDPRGVPSGGDWALEREGNGGGGGWGG